MEKKKENFVLDLTLVNQVRVAALAKVDDDKLSNQMRQMYGGLSSACASILALEYIEKLDK